MSKKKKIGSIEETCNWLASIQQRKIFKFCKICKICKIFLHIKRRSPTDQEDHDDGRISDSFENWTKLSDDAHPSDPEVLAHRNFEKEERNSARDHRKEVGNKKSP